MALNIENIINTMSTEVVKVLEGISPVEIHTFFKDLDDDSISNPEWVTDDVLDALEQIMEVMESGATASDSMTNNSDATTASVEELGESSSLKTLTVQNLKVDDTVSSSKCVTTKTEPKTWAPKTQSTVVCFRDIQAETSAEETCFSFACKRDLSHRAVVKKSPVLPVLPEFGHWQNDVCSKCWKASKKTEKCMECPRKATRHLIAPTPSQYGGMGCAPGRVCFGNLGLKEGRPCTCLMIGNDRKTGCTEDTHIVSYKGVTKGGPQICEPLLRIEWTGKINSKCCAGHVKKQHCYCRNKNDKRHPSLDHIKEWSAKARGKQLCTTQAVFGIRCSNVNCLEDPQMFHPDTDMWGNRFQYRIPTEEKYDMCLFLGKRNNAFGKKFCFNHSNHGKTCPHGSRCNMFHLPNTLVRRLPRNEWWKLVLQPGFQSTRASQRIEAYLAKKEAERNARPDANGFVKQKATATAPVLTSTPKRVMPTNAFGALEDASDDEE